MLATSDFRDGNAVIGRVRPCLTPETSVNGHVLTVLKFAEYYHVADVRIRCPELSAFCLIPLPLIHE